MSYMVGLESDRPQLLKQKSSIRKTHLFASNGLNTGADNYKDKESMNDEIIHLKKSLQAQKSDNQQMKVKLRRLEEDGAKRLKQIEELLDPTKGFEYTCGLVDNKEEGSVVVNGLKKRILKLEQQCREKQNALSKLQSELRTTNLEELKITVQTYFKEIQRLRIILDDAEKVSGAESKCSQRHQKALSSIVHRLTENVKHLQQENAALREELNTDSPATGIKGYREWSRQRLLRRLFQVERRLEDSRRHINSANGSATLNMEADTIPKEAPRFPIATETPGFYMATETVVSMGTVTEEERATPAQRNDLDQFTEGRLELQESQTNKKQVFEQMLTRVEILEEDRSKLVQTEVCSPSPTLAEPRMGAQQAAGQEEENERADGCMEKGEKGEEALRMDVEMIKREKVALIIQTNWREHRNRVIVMLQSVIRGHLHRDSWLKDLLKNKEKKYAVSLRGRNASGGLDVDSLTLMQSAFRGHLARSNLAIKSSGFALPSPTESYPPALVQRMAGLTDAPSKKAHRELHSTAEFDADAAVESDNSDDIVVSPSHPLKSRESLH